MSVGGVGGDQPPIVPVGPNEPTGSPKPFSLPSSWQNELNSALDEINPDNPQDVQKALKILKQVAEDPKAPASVKATARDTITEIEQGYQVSKNPIQLVQPYLSIANLTMPLGPGKPPLT